MSGLGDTGRGCPLLAPSRPKITPNCNVSNVGKTAGVPKHGGSVRRIRFRLAVPRAGHRRFDALDEGMQPSPTFPSGDSTTTAPIEDQLSRVLSDP
jgi:hypothetical protein